MGLTRFLEDLLERGAVIMPRRAIEPSDEDLASADVILRALDRRTRLELAHEPPELSLEVARWAARLLHQICAFMADRPEDDDELRAALATPAPQSGLPCAAYSADLLLSYLPDALTLARARADDDDALVAALITLCRVWPLSSVGVPGLGSLDLEPIRENPALAQLHLDRALERDDRERLQISWVHQAAIAALGDYTDLPAGKIDPDERHRRLR